MKVPPYRFLDVHVVLLGGFAFILPLSPRLASLLAIIVLVNWLVGGFFKINLKRLAHPLALAMVGLYLTQVISLLYTDDFQTAGSKLETKLSLLLMPIILFTAPAESSKKYNSVLLAFVTGCLVAGLISVGGAAYGFLNTGKNLFFYQDLGSFLTFHPAYFALYSLFSFFCLWSVRSNKIDDIPEWLSKKVLLTAMIFFGMLILLLSSRMQLIIFILLFPLMMMSYWKEKQVFRERIWYLVGAGVLISGLIILLPTTRKRIVSVGKIVEANLSGTSKNNNIRALIWKDALGLAKEQPLAGYGIGDVQTVLDKRYENRRNEEALKKHLNAHNQYLQTLLSGGIPALFCLLVILFYYPFSKDRSSYYLTTILSIIFILSFFTESMLETQRGVLFFGFFMSFLGRGWLKSS